VRALNVWPAAATNALLLVRVHLISCTQQNLKCATGTSALAFVILIFGLCVLACCSSMQHELCFRFFHLPQCIALAAIVPSLQYLVHDGLYRIYMLLFNNTRVIAVCTATRPTRVA
jgi:hypothetical protein